MTDPVLVTGAGGFLGGWLVRALAARGDRVVAWARSDRLSTLDLLGPPNGLVRETGDVRSSDRWREILARHRPARIIHLAGESQVRRAMEHPREAWGNNLLGTLAMLDEVRAAAVPVRAVLVASSVMAYGPPRYLPYDEAHPLEARAPYDASKSAADLCARSYAATFDLPVVVVRSANLYGGGDLNTARIVPEACRALLENREVLMRSDGTPERDFLHVEDAVDGYLRLLDATGTGRVAGGEAFNLGTGIGTPVRVVIEDVLRSAGRETYSVRVGPRRPAGEIDRQALDSSKVRAALGWAPRTPIEKGLAETWAWYRDRADDVRRAWAGIPPGAFV